MPKLGASHAWKCVLLAICYVSFGWTPLHADAPFLLAEWPASAPNPGFRLLDGQGQHRTLEDYRGHVSIVFFGFTQCPDVCPGELFKLAQVVHKLGREGQQVRVLFVSLDAKRDSPGAVQAYAASFDSTFVGLTGSAAAVNAAAASFSVQFAQLPLSTGNYTMTHSTGSYLFDRAGRLRLVGTLDTPVADWVHDVALLAQR